MSKKKRQTTRLPGHPCKLDIFDLQLVLIFEQKLKKTNETTSQNFFHQH